jgi:hypothetical protein
VISCSNTEDKQKVKKQTESSQIELWNGKNFEGWEFFLDDSNVKPEDVWTVENGILHCAGVPNGYIRTVKRFQSYKLNVEWRWTAEPGNSGVLLHAQKPDKIWPVCIEGQLMSGNAGDFYLIGGTTVNEQEDPKNRRIVKKAESSENSPGEWNHYEIYCIGDSISLTVNGILQNTAGGASVTSGHLAFQSEGKPIAFRKIVLTKLQK